eukprot:7347679-Pyramimonas_sp.AAC.1
MAGAPGRSGPPPTSRRLDFQLVNYNSSSWSTAQNRMGWALNVKDFVLDALFNQEHRLELEQVKAARSWGHTAGYMSWFAEAARTGAGRREASGRTAIA